MREMALYNAGTEATRLANRPWTEHYWSDCDAIPAGRLIFMLTVNHKEESEY